jgi:hypothetical protein
VKTKQEILAKRMERLEEAVATLIYKAEHWSLTGATMWDMKCRRVELMEAARRYGKAVDALARPL